MQIIIMRAAPHALYARVQRSKFTYEPESAGWKMSNVPDKFHPPKSFKFPKRSFGSKDEKRSFRGEWCEKFDWLHYDVAADAAFCHLCMSAEKGKKFLSSTKRDPAFITKGFTYWKEGTSAFTKHSSSACHREAVLAIQSLPAQVQDVGEVLSSQHKKEKATNREMFRKVLQNLRFLVRQGLAIRGHDNGADSNFIQLLNLRALDCPEVLEWTSKKSNKYTSADIQNECLQIMGLHILRNISHSIQSSRLYHRVR